MLEYLKRVGFALDDGVIIKRNFRFPTLSCRLGRGKSVIVDDSVITNSDNALAIVFVLSYFVSDDFAKQQVEFSFDEWNEKGLDADAFLKVKRDVPQLFDFFSIQNSLLNRIFVSRLHGRKAYKKRNFPLAIKWARVKKEFGVIDNTNAIGNSVGVAIGGSDVEINNKIIYLNNVMQNCVKKAADTYSYMPFELYFDSYKKMKRLNGMNKIADTEVSGNSVPHRTSRNLVFKEFVGKVKALQKGC